MSTAAKHFDPQLGIDIHMYAMPPFPLPTPHIGLVLDPFDYLPFLGATVTVNGVKRATAGTGGLDIHIPLGMWTPQLSMPMGPQFDGEEIFMGSKTVTADGDPFSRLAAPVLDCNLAGLIPPFRIKKLKKPFRSLWLPTGINVAIPTNVKVGGPLTISLMAMLFHAAFDVPPSLSSTLVWSPIPYPEEIGREEAFFRRTDHRLPARSRGRHADQGPVPAAWLQ
ncbi:hypothetical protein ACU17_16395 [Xanthomonas oryzae pv. oryzicola]|nr:hypothetical protein ACU17_16395 [Xanthomonas oryzae pv. oryzicola]